MPVSTGSSAQEAAPPAFTQRLAVCFAGAFLGVGIMLPYFPVWLKTLSLTDWQVGILLSLPMFLRIVTTPLIAARADKARDRADVLLILAVLSLVSTAAFFVVDGFWPLLALVLIQAVVTAPLVLLIDAITITGVRRYGVDYARVRMWGSLSFVVANIIGGMLIARQDGTVVLPLLVVGCAVMVAAAFLTPRVGKPRRPSPLAGIDLHSASGALGRPDFLLRLTGGTLIHASHAMLYGFSTIYWADLGLSGTTIGLLWAVSVVGEVILFQFATRLIGHWSVLAIVTGGGLLAALRWAAFPFDFGVAWYFALQVLHVASFAAILLAQQRLIVEQVGEDREAAAQGLLFFLNGITMGTLMLASGYLFDRFGADAFAAMSVAALCGVACHYGGLRLARKARANDA